MAFDDGIKVGPIAYIGLVSVIVLVALVLLLQVLYYQQHSGMLEADLATQGPPVELTKLTAKQQTALVGRGYVNRELGIVKIGIERAKELVVTELAAGKTPSEVIGPERPADGPVPNSDGSRDAKRKAEPAKSPTTTDAEDQPKKQQESKDDAKS